MNSPAETLAGASRASLPPAAGPLSELVIDLLGAEPRQAATASEKATALAAAVALPLGDDDLQLALYLCFELHYRGFDAVDPGWEWSPHLLALRGALERRFLTALAEAVELDQAEPTDVAARLFALEAADTGPSLARELEREPELERFREFVVHRSLYQLKEADPHSWAIPRLRGAPKAALLEVQSDEYGGGRPERMHSALFAQTMRALGLEAVENAYLSRIPGVTLATVNLMSAFGLRAARRGAIVGHLAMFEMTSSGPNRRYAAALRRLGFDGGATEFYDEHVEADAVHENIAAHDLAGGLAREEPELAGDILFGAAALLELERRFAQHLLDAWAASGTSLRRPL